ncbi:hypothetical protein [Puerhibacterium puerhi]|uniref:hypothetical protein n=1 Tax=Puerhibacterium puerhi TaxID=2692623 RepID=UPI00135C25D8|nr:hypothetical protein [Puerhibacterium puerhi]
MTPWVPHQDESLLLQPPPARPDVVEHASADRAYREVLQRWVVEAEGTQHRPHDWRDAR